MKEGTVTIDINDYDDLLKSEQMSKPVITEEGNKVKFYFPILESFIKEKVEKEYKGYKPSYYDTTICVSFEKEFK